MKATFTLFTFFFFAMSTFHSLHSQPKAFDYNKAWDDVQKAEDKGLPETALKSVNQIYQQAKKDKNEPQLIKSLIHQLKFTADKEDDVLPSNIQKVEKELRTSTGLSKLILHSMLGEMYWRYYQTNRWKFRDRTQTANLVLSDIATWSLEKIIDTTFQHYLESCKTEEASLKQLRTSEYTLLLNQGNKKGQALRPTLFDFLAHRALAFFQNEEPDVIQPSYTFSINKEEFLSDAATFSRIKIESGDSLSTKFQALSIFQTLVKFHLNDSLPNALVDVDLERLAFVRRYSSLSTKDALYLSSLQSLEKKFLTFEISTTISYHIANEYLRLGNGYRPLQPETHPKKWKLKEAFELCESAKKRFSNSDGASLCQNLQSLILTKSIKSELEEVQLPELPFKALIGYKNFTNLYWRAIKISRQEVLEQRKQFERNYQVDREARFLAHFLSKPFIKFGNAQLPSDGDYQNHSVEVKLDGLPIGEYMIVFSNKSDFSITENGMTYSFLTVSNISFALKKQADGSNEVYVLHRETGLPLSGVKAQLYYATYDNQRNEMVNKNGQAFSSNSEGYFLIPTHQSNEHYPPSFCLEFSLGDDKLNTQSFEDRNCTMNQYSDQEHHSYNLTYFFLDRAIYRPGQTIFFKGLATSTDGKKSSIITNQSITVSFRDANYQEIKQQTFTTNEFGTFNGAFTAPSSGLLGGMHLECTDGSGQVAFSVEEYKRPKFEVKFDPVKGSFRLGDSLSIGGLAQAYSGANIDGAKVRYRVVRSARFPFWFWCKWGYYPTSPSMEITNGEAVTDASGKFTIPFVAIPDATVDVNADPTFSYVVYADVTDLNGETHSGETTVNIGYRALQIGVDVTDVDLSDPSSHSKKWAIISTNQALEYEPAKGLIIVYQLLNPARPLRARLWEQPDKFVYTPEEFQKLFPNDVYANENDDLKWQKGNIVYQKSFDTENEKSFGFQNLKDWKLGKYLIEIISQDKNGQTVTEVDYFTLYDTKAKTLSLPVINHFRLLTPVVEPGGKAQVLIGTASQVKALIEVVKDGQTISKEWLSLKNQQKIIDIPIKEEYRGNIAVSSTFVFENRLYTNTHVINVPYTNKELDIQFATFRDKLQPGQKEEWKIKIKGKTVDKVAAEMVATMYDASLDVFRSNEWNVNFWGWFHPYRSWESAYGFGANYGRAYSKGWNKQDTRSITLPDYDELNWFGYNFYYYGGGPMRKGEAVMAKSMMAAPSSANLRMELSVDKEEEVHFDATAGGVPAPLAQERPTASQAPPLRQNFNETAFFYPSLKTDANGEISIGFTLPDALTRWKMLGFAHTSDLKWGLVQKELVAQKDLMVVPNQPRFFREGDKMIFSAKVTSLTDTPLKGTAKLEFLDALTGKTISNQLLVNTERQTLNFELQAKSSTSLEWLIQVPEGLQALTYRIVAQAGSFSDGEEMTLPVVTNRTLVTETLPLPIRGKQSKTFVFDKLKNNTSTTLKHYKYTLEFTPNPAWYAVQALPYLMEYPYECAEQTFSRYYANSLASHIANSNPKIKQVFETWKNIQPNALLSNLEKNQELKSALLEETPWVLQAQNEADRKRAIGLLFDLNRMADEQSRALDKLGKAQASSGGFSWFPGMQEDRYISQHILAGLGHLQAMGVSSGGTATELASKAVIYLQNELSKDYARLKEAAKRKEIKLEEYQPDYLNIHALYALSFFKTIEPDKKSKEAIDFYVAQTKKYWLRDNLYLQGLIALVLHRNEQKTSTTAIIQSLKEKALHSEEMGMYYKQSNGYYWYQASIETQALLIEVFDEVANDQKAVEDLKVWLLKQKQTQDWKTTKATVEACYALLRRGTDVLANTQMPEIKVGNTPLPKLEGAEAGTGYVKTSWNAEQIKTDMAEITITKQDEGVAWGAAYWQYFEQLDKITPASSPLQLKKQLFLQQNTDRGPVISPITAQTDLKVGDLVRVRIELRSDRNMEYVHLKDMRAAGFEPIATLSEAKYQDGLWYYESPRDLSTSFFMGFVPKGTYVFEYALRVSQKGDFSNGISTIQCMYAPEFGSHSEGVRLKVRY